MDDAKSRARLVVDLGLLAVGALAIYTSATMGNPIKQPIAPGDIPMAVALGMVFLASLDLFFNLWGRRVVRADKRSRDAAMPVGRFGVPSWVVAGVVVAVAVTLWETVGGITSIVVSMIALLIADGKVSRRQGLLASGLIGVFTWLVFGVGFGVPLLP